MITNIYIIKIIVSTDFQTAIRIDKKYVPYFLAIAARKRNSIKELDLTERVAW